jgi:hypothetical protein
MSDNQPFAVILLLTAFGHSDVYLVAQGIADEISEHMMTCSVQEGLGAVIRFKGFRLPHVPDSIEAAVKMTSEPVRRRCVTIDTTQVLTCEQVLYED